MTAKVDKDKYIVVRDCPMIFKIVTSETVNGHSCPFASLELPIKLTEEKEWLCVLTVNQGSGWMFKSNQVPPKLSSSFSKVFCYLLSKYVEQNSNFNFDGVRQIDSNQFKKEGDILTNRNILASVNELKELCGWDYSNTKKALCQSIKIMNEYPLIIGSNNEPVIFCIGESLDNETFCFSSEFIRYISLEKAGVFYLPKKLFKLKGNKSSLAFRLGYYLYRLFKMNRGKRNVGRIKGENIFEKLPFRKIGLVRESKNRSIRQQYLLPLVNAFSELKDSGLLEWGVEYRGNPTTASELMGMGYEQLCDCVFVYELMEKPPVVKRQTFR